MKCPKCGSETYIYNSRSAYGGTNRRRSRKCEKCGHRFTTYETIAEARGRVPQKKIQISLTAEETDVLMKVLEELCEVER